MTHISSAVPVVCAAPDGEGGVLSNPIGTISIRISVAISLLVV